MISHFHKNHPLPKMTPKIKPSKREFIHAECTDISTQENENIIQKFSKVQCCEAVAIAKIYRYVENKYK